MDNGGDALQAKCESKKYTVHKMIAIYCRKKHGSPKRAFCADCDDLLGYARKRADSCPQIENRAFCSGCPTPCYREDMREKIKAAMRFSGPRMLVYHPFLTIRHALGRLFRK